MKQSSVHWVPALLQSIILGAAVRSFDTQSWSEVFPHMRGGNKNVVMQVGQRYHVATPKEILN